MIPQEIINLVNMALRDGVITYREREAISAEAVKKGVGSAEINEYIDRILQESIGKMPRESLKRCPGCGVQIPLISDTCHFCGLQLTASAKVYGTDGYAGDSDAVRIINQENAKTVMEGDGDIKNCPDCGAPLPLISNICEHCGHIVKERSNSQYNINNLIETVNQNLRNMDKCRVSFADAIKDKLFVILVILLVITFVVGGFSIMANESLVPILMMVFGFGAVFARKFLSHNVVKSADDLFFRSKSEFELCCRHTDTIYGGSKEAKSLIAKFDEAIQQVEESRRSNRNKILLLVSASIGILLLLASGLGSESSNYSNMRSHYAGQFDLLYKEVVIPHGVVNSFGTVTADYQETDAFSPYLQVADKAVLTATMESNEGVILVDNECPCRLKVSNLLIKSTGRRYNGPTSSVHFQMLLLDEKGELVDVLMEESLAEPQAVIPNRLPGGEVLNYHTLMESAGYSCLVNFVGRDTASAPELLEKINRTKSFGLVLK